MFCMTLGMCPTLVLGEKVSDGYMVYTLFESDVHVLETWILKLYFSGGRRWNLIIVFFKSYIRDFFPQLFGSRGNEKVMDSVFHAISSFL